MADEKLEAEGDEESDAAAMAEIEGREPSTGRTPPPAPPGPAAGPHADPALTNPEATPGTGALPNPAPGEDADPGSD